MNKIGKHQLENDFFSLGNLNNEIGYFQKMTDEVKNFEYIQISILPMDFDNDIKLKDRKLIEQEWIENLPFLDNIKHLSIRHRVDEKFLDSISRMKNLESLFFWTSQVHDISPLKNLKKINFLHLSSFSKLEDISPILELNNLKKLSIESCFKIDNYEIIGQMNDLVALSIEGDSFAPKNLILNSLKPFSELQNLKHLNLSTTSIKDKSFLELLNLKNLIRFDATWRMKREIREKIKTEHASLKSGFFMVFNFDKNEFYEDIEWWKD